MRHLVEGKKLGRIKKQRTALTRGLLTNLILHERIETTLPKAKYIRPLIEHMITTAKKGSLAAKRSLMDDLFNKQIVVKKIMQEIAPRYAERHGGYTRIIKKGYRVGDAAEVAIIEFV
jgi:large subunit ribosomal protein L17